MRPFRLLYDLLWLLYPLRCAACDRDLVDGECALCTHCRYRLPRTHFHRFPGNVVERHFWGKIPLQAAAACFHFSKGERVQRMIHQLKYKQRPDVGVEVGTFYGKELLHEPVFASVDVIVPVPLHPEKLRLRGYNQAACFAEGLAAGMGRTALPEALRKTTATATQTRKHRFDRFRNVDRVFTVASPDQVANRHVLLVDDVITTGSTLVACAEALLEVPGVRISIVGMAAA
jgi:ComF family protein